MRCTQRERSVHTGSYSRHTLERKPIHLIVTWAVKSAHEAERLSVLKILGFTVYCFLIGNEFQHEFLRRPAVGRL